MGVVKEECALFEQAILKANFCSSEKDEFVTKTQFETGMHELRDAISLAATSNDAVSVKEHTRALRELEDGFVSTVEHERSVMGLKSTISLLPGRHRASLLSVLKDDFVGTAEYKIALSEQATFNASFSSAPFNINDTLQEAVELLSPIPISLQQLEADIIALQTQLQTRYPPWRCAQDQHIVQPTTTIEAAATDIVTIPPEPTQVKEQNASLPSNHAELPPIITTAIKQLETDITALKQQQQQADYAVHDEESRIHYGELVQLRDYRHALCCMVRTYQTNNFAANRVLVQRTAQLSLDDLPGHFKALLDHIASELAHRGRNVGIGKK